jgi:hypothetical protein
MNQQTKSGAILLGVIAGIIILYVIIARSFSSERNTGSGAYNAPTLAAPQAIDFTGYGAYNAPTLAPQAIDFTGYGAYNAPPTSRRSSKRRRSSGRRESLAGRTSALSKSYLDVDFPDVPTGPIVIS